MYQGAFAQLMDTMNMKLYNVKTVNELTFKGYVDHLIQLKNTVPIDGDDSPPFDRFGWFYMVNNLFIQIFKFLFHRMFFFQILLSKMYGNLMINLCNEASGFDGFN